MRSSALLWTGALLALYFVVPARPAAGLAQGVPGQLQHRAVRDLAAGKLLVAARNLPDPNFARTVILLGDFSTSGAIGLIVNRPTELPLARVLPDVADPPGRQTTIFFGGPVPEQGVLALLRSASRRTDSRHIVKDVYLVDQRKVLEEMITIGAGPDRFRVYLGYAGWTAGQLERETAEGAWHILEGDGDVVFDPDSKSTWERQMRRVEAISARAHLVSGLLRRSRRDAVIARTSAFRCARRTMMRRHAAVKAGHIWGVPDRNNG